MKFGCNINATAPTIFSEQLSNVIDLFQQWNDCERAVMLFAVLKKVPFPITKFLQSVIDASLQQAQSKEQVKTLERNANCAKYINSLSEIYKNFKYNDTQLPIDSIFFDTDRSIDNIDKFYDKKEEILHDILKMMPILTIGNDEAKSAYLEFIPMTVKDATRRIVSSTLVQQIFCYVLIHPAFTTDDRESVDKYLKYLEAHISSHEPNFYLYHNGSSPTSEPTIQTTPSNWQAIAPPTSKSTESISSTWGSSHLPRFYGEDNNYRNQPAPISSSPRHFGGSDDHHISFSQNGKIVNDIDDTNQTNTKIGYKTLSSVTQHLFSPILEMKRRHSDATTNQTTREPLAQTSHGKSRSNSVSAISNFGGSDISMLDEWKSLIHPPQHHVGMSNIAQWLKSLRLHKYIFLFSHKTYEQMLDIAEEHLINVTQGARHKLVNCIQKLKERHSLLCQVENDLLCGQITIGKAVDEMFHIVLTPMKPIESFNKQDVANQFLKVLDLVSTKMAAKHIVPQDEECINTLVYILEKAVHSEAFVTHTNLLKEHRYSIQQIKNQFQPKSHRQRPIKLHDYLPKKTNTAFISVNRPVGSINRSISGSNRSISSISPSLPFASALKNDYPLLYGREQRTDLFKVPKSVPIAVRAPTHTRPQIISGSVESISSGYQSDGYPIGMSNIRMWLKSLRLHKYIWVFDNVSYDKMFTFTEEYLKSLNITQGASHKLALCIEKLKIRIETMKQIESTLSQNRMHVPEAIVEIDSMILSPMKPMRLNCDTDVGYQLWKVLNLNNFGNSLFKDYSQITSRNSPLVVKQQHSSSVEDEELNKVNNVFNLLSSNNYDDQTIQLFQRILDTSISSEAFIDCTCTLREMKLKVGRLGRRMIR